MKAHSVFFGGWTIAALLAAGLLGVNAADGKADGKPRKGAPTRGEPIRRAEPKNETPAAKPAPAAPAPAFKAEEPPPGSTVIAHDGFLSVGFDRLSTFTYIVPEDLPGDKKEEPKEKPDQIPAAVRALNQKPISLKGYMLPLKVEGGLVTELLIMKDQSMCCFGTVPKINEWVSVKMVGKGVKAVMDQPVTFFGKLFVGEIMENGYLVGIYRMDGERIGETDGI
ncbi:MAG: DUF3299 domain-containing protein [Verrucomicrobia bacterium]|nr:DUF3299 domain-containing protein [Verrucomicrobiota bacterium]